MRSPIRSGSLLSTSIVLRSSGLTDDALCRENCRRRSSSATRPAISGSAGNLLRQKVAHDWRRDQIAGVEANVAAQRDGQLPAVLRFHQRLGESEYRTAVRRRGDERLRAEHARRGRPAANARLRQERADPDDERLGRRNARASPPQAAQAAAIAATIIAEARTRVAGIKRRLPATPRLNGAAGAASVAAASVTSSPPQVGSPPDTARIGNPDFAAGVLEHVNLHGVSFGRRWSSGYFFAASGGISTRYGHGSETRLCRWRS